ncbi:MAG: ribonuclease HII [Nitrososphaerales archaeon]|nr:ribonuclease HII [Nitrososphaerales archaeon]
MIVAGVDDAGRGSVMGPLVIAGVSIEESRLNRLIDLGVKDSKLLSPSKRMKLYQLIRNIAHKISYLKIPPNEIDRYVILGRKFKKLNYLEAISMAKVIDELGCDVVYVDASDVDVNRFKEQISSMLKKDLKIFSLHHADRIYPIVSAASIIAKVERDLEIEKLKLKYGDFGSGYPSDPRTREFLIKWVEKYNAFPDDSRKSWKVWKKLTNKTLDLYTDFKKNFIQYSSKDTS